MSGIEEQKTNSIPPIARDTSEEPVLLDMKKAASWSLAIFAVSSAVAFSVRRTVYGMIENNVSFRIPINRAVGFGITAGVTVAAASLPLSRIDAAQKMSRRQFLASVGTLSAAAALGGVAGSHAAEVVEQQQQALKE